DVLELVGMSPLDAQAFAERYRDAEFQRSPVTSSEAESVSGTGSESGA
ncbi:MAG: hypothetical protein ACI8UP_002814, partial [Porticoccaceae bacterium]